VRNPKGDGYLGDVLSRVNRRVLSAFCVLTLLFLCLPILIVVPMSFSGAESLVFPPPSFSLRWYYSFFGDKLWLDAALNSVIVALCASTGALVFGTMAAYGLVRSSFRWRAVVEANFIAPLALPVIVVAVALYIFFSQLGILGNFWSLVAAHMMLVTPYVVLLMSLAIAAFDERIEQVALTLGASRLRVLTSVVLPNVKGSAVAAWLLTFVMSFDEVVVTLFVSGTYATIPKKMFNELVMQINPTITAIATLLILFSIVSVALVASMTRGRFVLPGPDRRNSR
jgi:ABC-type spermidine/putrescine transport system permease subunit II